MDKIVVAKYRRQIRRANAATREEEQALLNN